MPERQVATEMIDAALATTGGGHSANLLTNARLLSAEVDIALASKDLTAAGKASEALQQAASERTTAKVELQAARSEFERLGAVADLANAEAVLHGGAGVAPAGATKTFMFTDVVVSRAVVETAGASGFDFTESRSESVKGVAEPVVAQTVKWM